MKKKTLLLLCIFLLLILVAAAFFLNQREAEIADAGISKNAPIEKQTLLYQGTEYPLRKHLQTVLLIGTDGTEAYTEQSEDERDFYSYQQADFLMLLVVDKDAKSTEVIQINRDTITDVPWLDVFGEYGGTERKQICLAFNYGDGGSSSCKNTVNAVSSLLFDLPIDAYIQIPMAAIPQVNDLVGGVTVTIPVDMTAVDPAFIQGKTIKLSGQQAEKFVRARQALADDTNTSRMGRHREYIDGFVKAAENALHSDSDFAIKSIEALGNALQSNLNVTQLSDLIQNLVDFTRSPVRFADGTLTVGARFYEFYVDEASLWKIIRNACCE